MCRLPQVKDDQARRGIIGDDDGMRLTLKMTLAASMLASCLAAVVSAVAREGEADLIEIYEHWGNFTLAAPPPEMKPIVLQVPEAFRYGSSKGATRNWGLNLLTYYPTFTSPQAPENASFGLNCKGDCNGRILVAIENRAHSIGSPRSHNSPNMGDYIARIELESLVPIGGTKRDLGPQHGFDNGYEVRIPASNGMGDRTDRHLFRLSEDRIHYNLAAKCSINQFAEGCILYFSLKCNPAIYVKVVAIDMKHIGEFADVVRKTDQFVTSMVRSPACI